MDGSVDIPNAQAVDALGLAVSIGNPRTLTAVNAFIEGMLAYEARAVEVLAAADADPLACLAQAYAAILHLLAESSDGPPAALPYLLAAEDAAPGAEARERMTTSFVRAWFDDDIPQAERIGEALLSSYPRDLLMLKLLHYHAFNQGRLADMLRVAESVRDANADAAYMHGMMAFAYEQCHLLDEAEAAAREALRLRRKEPWAQHALAHVMLTRGRITEGAAFLEAMRDTWTGLNSFMETHLWWHLALFRLSQGYEAEVLDIYDQHCWALSRAYSQDQVGAVSLLARLELSGVDVGDRWRELGDYLAQRGADTVQPFLTLQYLYGLARAGRSEAETLHAAIRAKAVTAPAYARETWAEVAVPLADGLLAQARGDYELAVRRLTPVLPRLADIGGSHAQRDLFELILQDAVIRSGRLDRAQQMLELRRAADLDGVPVNRALARVYEGLGLPAQAAVAVERLRRAEALRHEGP